LFAKIIVLTTTRDSSYYYEYMQDLQNAKPKIAIIEFPGSNCETESIHAVTQAGMEAHEFLWNRPASELAAFDGYFIIGGFSYEDRSRSGVISAKNILMDELIKQAKVGKPIIGVCNGAQILIESGLVPGLKDEQIGGALAVNVRMKDNHVVGTGFYNTWCNHKVISRANIFMKNFEESEIFEMPIAHGEGRFVFPPEVLEVMRANGQILFKYCDQSGSIVDNFPINPNGTIENIAAVGNPSGNVIAMMPHPERSKISSKFFTAMRKYIEQRKVKSEKLKTDSDSNLITGSSSIPFLSEKVQLGFLATYSSKSDSEAKGVFSFEYKNLNINFPKTEIKTYVNQGQQLIIQSVITDKEANTINQTLKELGIKSTVSKTTHWEMDIEADIEAIIKSEELHNPNKENIIQKLEGAGKGLARFYLVSYNTDVDGESKKEILQHEGITVSSLKKSILWAIDGDYDAVIDSNILANPFSQNLVRY
jgi:phosphoribosylformylglycinamidine synthase subunit PurQ / glutaminase